MPVLAIANTKGGASKTTLTVCLADHWRIQGRRVVCLDTDPNQMLHAWLGNAPFEGVTVEVVAEDDVVDVAVRASAEADIVIIDVAGALTGAVLYAAGVSDAVVIPAKASRTDALEAARTLHIVENAAKMTRRRIPAKALLTQVNPRAQVTAHVREQLRAFSVPVMDAMMPNRTIYAIANVQRSSPVGMGDEAARGDIAAIAGEIARLTE